MDKRDASLSEEFFAEAVWIVTAVDDALDTSPDKDAGAEAAWRVGAIKGCTSDGDAHNCGLDDGVLLSV